MEVTQRLELLLQLDELKVNTDTTREVAQVIERLIRVEGVQKTELVNLVERVRESFSHMMELVKRRRSVTSKLDKLYCLFHQFSVGESYRLLSESEKKTGLKISEILWQILIEKEFMCFLSRHLIAPSVENASQVPDSARTLSNIEMNAIRYTAGYVMRKVEEKYAKKKTKEAHECAVALQMLAGKLHNDPQREHEDPTQKWVNMVNRGGLYIVEDAIYDLFVSIELIVDSKLSEIIKNCGEGIEQVQKSNLAWVCEDEEVQSIWSQINLGSIEDEHVISEELLKEIVYMWVTTRGHSKTHKIKEEYKKNQKKTIKGTRSLRKELESQ